MQVNVCKAPKLLLHMLLLVQTRQAGIHQDKYIHTCGQKSHYSMEVGYLRWSLTQLWHFIVCFFCFVLYGYVKVFCISLFHSTLFFFFFFNQLLVFIMQFFTHCLSAPLESLLVGSEPLCFFIILPPSTCYSYRLKGSLHTQE